MRLRSAPTNGLTVCRMRLHMTSVGYGTYRPRRQLRTYARAYTYRGLRAFASLSMARSVRKSTRAEPHQQVIYDALAISSQAGATQRTTA